MISLTPHPISTSNALATSSEAASPSVSAGSPPSPSTRTMTFPWLSERCTAARRSLSAVLDRFAAWCRSWSGDVELTTHAVCPECERACALVNPDVPTALPCQGRREIADCLICIRSVEFGRGDGCPNGRRHLLANKRDKPRLTLVPQENANA
jgi:hypothetical protein